MVTKTDRAIWYSISFASMLWVMLAIVGGDAGFIHFLGFVFAMSCIFQPNRNAKKREKKRKQEIMDKAFENLAKGE